MHFFLIFFFITSLPYTYGARVRRANSVRPYDQNKLKVNRNRKNIKLISIKDYQEGEAVLPKKKPKLIQKKVFLNPFSTFESLIGFLLDLLLLLILLLSTLYGYRHGVLSYIAMCFLGTLPAYFFRYILEGGLTAMVGEKMPGVGGIANIGALVILVLLYFFFSRMVYQLLHHLFRETSLVNVDNFLGAAFFLLGTSIFLSVFMIVLEKLSISLPHKYTDHSFIYHEMISVEPQILFLGRKIGGIIRFILRG